MFKSSTEAGPEEGPKLDANSRFRFSCHEKIACFTRCCADVNIFLTPYDVLRMRTALKISSEEFINKYTITPFLSEQKLPLVLLRMREDESKSCPFVTPRGCSIYQDRPWSCRMFPLEIASTDAADRPDGQEFRLAHRDGFACLGFDEAREWTVAEWRCDQGIDDYEKKNAKYDEITREHLLNEGEGLGPVKNHIFFITAYDLDRFRRLLLESSFLARFEIAPEVAAAIQTDDEALLDFGFDWLRFSLFGENTIKVKEEELARQKKALLKQKSKSKSKRGAHEKNRKPKLSG